MTMHLAQSSTTQSHTEAKSDAPRESFHSCTTEDTTPDGCSHCTFKHDVTEKAKAHSSGGLLSNISTLLQRFFRLLPCRGPSREYLENLHLKNEKLKEEIEQAKRRDEETFRILEDMDKEVEEIGREVEEVRKISERNGQKLEEISRKFYDTHDDYKYDNYCYDDYCYDDDSFAESVSSDNDNDDEPYHWEDDQSDTIDYYDTENGEYEYLLENDNENVENDIEQ